MFFSVSEFFRSNKRFCSSNFILFYTTLFSGFLSLFLHEEQKNYFYDIGSQFELFKWFMQHNTSVIATDLFKVHSRFLRQEDSIKIEDCQNLIKIVKIQLVIIIFYCVVNKRYRACSFSQKLLGWQKGVFKCNFYDAQRRRAINGCISWYLILLYEKTLNDSFSSHCYCRESCLLYFPIAHLQDRNVSKKTTALTRR